MEKYYFGTSRSITLFDETDDSEKQQYIVYMKAFLPDLATSFQVVGSVNDMEPLVNHIDAIRVHNASKNELAPIAKDLVQLKQIVDHLQEIWHDYQNEMFLPRNEHTLAAYEQFKKEWSDRDGIDINYWLHFSFREFNIRYIF